jgi:carbon-monoxide dehydrogenase large subunit
VPHNYPLDKLEPGLDETAFYDPTNFTYPAGTHICEVEIDPETGKTRSSTSPRATTSATSSIR